ncbi:MAG: outer membrane beta-barrel domain-containing protein [Bdellovibrionaceae bacterium]|nr:outer membrane beta-barrel domain-containing protein [Bdellovibrio sp.]
MKQTVMNTITSAALALMISVPAYGAGSGSGNSADANPPAAKASDKVDLKKLEDKYWSAKDDEYSVIQNRTFAKAGKFYLSGVYGPLINDPFAKSRAFGGMLGYYITEDFGVELSYLNYNSTRNDTVVEYERTAATVTSTGIAPDYNLVKSAMAASVTYTPFYAKMAFMNKAILYFDMGFTLGAGITNYEVQKISKDGSGNKSNAAEMKSAPHFEIGVMQQLFINQYLAFRLDIKNSFYSQKSQRYEIGNNAAESSRPETTKSANDTTITFGITLFTK